MAFIYEIINDVNQKRYIGKTEFDINKRLKEHCHDAFRERNKDRPLYRAMRKYGIEHFSIHLIEETDNPEERETYWIKEKDTYHNGYNATLGGDGKKYLDYDLIIKTYNEVLNIVETARICNVSKDSVSHILYANNINTVGTGYVTKIKTQQAVYMCNIDNHAHIIKSFPSAMDAARYLVENKITSSKARRACGHIGEVCRGKRKSAYGYYWEYMN